MEAPTTGIYIMNYWQTLETEIYVSAPTPTAFVKAPPNVASYDENLAGNK